MLFKIYENIVRVLQDWFYQFHQFNTKFSLESGSLDLSLMMSQKISSEKRTFGF